MQSTTSELLPHSPYIRPQILYIALELWTIAAEPKALQLLVSNIDIFTVLRWQVFGSNFPVER